MMDQRWIKMMSTFFYIGYAPFAPGTLASLAGMVLALVLGGQTAVYLICLAVVTGTGFAVSGDMERIEGKKDPGYIVIDEVAGIMIACFLLPMTAAVAWTTFFLFRAFDMFKIYPANRCEALGGSRGIMMDDIVAGLYTNLIMRVALFFIGG